jgi:Transposase DNA-binding/Transposase Tn5 dimerisation domain
MENWAESELGTADFGDKRLTERFVKIATDLAANPEGSVPQASGDWAGTKGAYRFWDNKNVTPERIREPHREKAIERAKEYGTILAAQDTMAVNYATHKATKGLGPIDAHRTQGILVHSVLAISPDGVPCGLLHQKVWSRNKEDVRTKEERRKLPIEEKESYRWLESVEATKNAVSAETHIITVADREADIFELFVLPRPKNMDLLIRAKQNRCVQVEDLKLKKLWESVEAVSESSETMTTHLEHIPGVPERDVTFTLRWRTVTILVPAQKKKKYQNVTLTAILVTEKEPPEGAEPLSWLLLTSLKVETFAQAALCVRWYRLRWLIERYHFVLKSGCGLEELQLETAERLERALATFCVVAWRLLWLTYQTRQTPNDSCEVAFQTYEWQALYAFTHKTNVLPPTPPSLHEATLLVAKLGGFLARASDGEPGVKTIWRGLRRLDDLSSMWLLLHSFASPTTFMSYG